MRRWLASSLNRKLSFMLLGAILIPLLSLGVVSYRIAAIETEEKVKQSSMSILRQIDANLEFIVQDVENMSVFLIGQEDIQKYLSNPDRGGHMQTVIMGFLSNLVFSKKYIANITVYPSNGNHPLSNTTIFRTTLSDDFQQKTFASKPGLKWWSSLYENITSTGTEKVVSLLRPIGSVNTYQPVGILSISVNQAAIQKILLQSGIAGEGYVMLLDRDRHILSGGPEKWLNRPVSEVFPNMEAMGEQRGFLNYDKGAQKKTIVYYKVPNVDWMLMAVIPYERYQAQNRYVLTLTAVAVGIAMLMIAAAVLFFVRKVTKPLRNLTHYLKDIQPEDEIPTYEVTSIDEVGLLMHSYNKLGQRIGRLKEQVQRNESLKKAADMQALQAQINPHFLYNTLASIHWMALMNRDPQIADMVGSLSDFLRFSLNKGSEYCRVRQEIDHVRHYANIQAIRYPNQFEIEFQVDAAAEEEMMLKLLLQPLIENALIHGIQKQKEVGQIKVFVELQADGIYFEVQDTGVGMEPEKLMEIEQLLHIKTDSNIPSAVSYGLRNVHERLRLHYGVESGLTIESAVGQGTKVAFTIPKVEESI